MSSLRNAVKGRAHKERSQPADRRRYGLLEKHKDYVLRARDYQKKQETLRILKEKATNRNPDEFYYKMINSKIVDGAHRNQNAAKQYTQEELQLMKTQDIVYLRIKAQSEQKKVERLQSSLHFLDQPRVNKHTYFAEDRNEMRELQPLVASKQLETERKSVLPKHIKRLRDAAYRELEERTERAKKLKSIVMTMTLQKELMGKGRKRKLRPDEIISPSELPVYRWRQERKR